MTKTEFATIRQVGLVIITPAGQRHNLEILQDTAARHFRDLLTQELVQSDQGHIDNREMIKNLVQFSSVAKTRGIDFIKELKREIDHPRARSYCNEIIRVIESANFDKDECPCLYGLVKFENIEGGFKSIAKGFMSRFR